MNSMTKHAATRSQQRAIPAALIDLLWEYGSELRHHGGDVLFFDKFSRQRVEREVSRGKLRALGDNALNCYAVLGEGGQVITLGHRRCRFKRP